MSATPNLGTSVSEMLWSKRHQCRRSNVLHSLAGFRQREAPNLVVSTPDKLP